MKSIKSIIGSIHQFLVKEWLIYSHVCCIQQELLEDRVVVYDLPEQDTNLAGRITATMTKRGCTVIASSSDTGGLILYISASNRIHYG